MDYAGTEWRIGDTCRPLSDSPTAFLHRYRWPNTARRSQTPVRAYSASILKSIRNYDYSEKLYDREPTVMSTVESAEYNWAAVHEGMWQVLNDHITRRMSTSGSTASGASPVKTGTAQKGEGIQNDGIFMCYAPYKDPEVAIFVVVERGGAGADVQLHRAPHHGRLHHHNGLQRHLRDGNDAS